MTWRYYSLFKHLPMKGYFSYFHVWVIYCNDYSYTEFCVDISSGFGGMMSRGIISGLHSKYVFFLLLFLIILYC